MPITQQSQIDLLDAALDWRRAVAKFRLQIQSCTTIEEVRLVLLLNPQDHNFLINPVETQTTIAVTQKHIQKTRRNNDWRRSRKPSEDPELLAMARDQGFNTWKEYMLHERKERDRLAQTFTPLHPGEKEETK